MSEKLSIVLPKQLSAQVDELTKLTGEDRSTIIRRLLTKGLEEVRLDLALDRYTKGRASLERAGELAGVSLWRLLEELRQRRIALRYTLEDAEEEIQKLLKATRTHRKASPA